MDADVDAIEAFFRRRYGREAMYLPSGRLGLYLAFRQWLSPGDRLLVSPVTDDVVFFTILAAGLVPVYGPVDPRTGNLDPAAIGDATWSTLRGVMTTNLYGTPDRMDLLDERSRRHGLVLIEDACHALDSRINGRSIGTFGAAAVFSLSKHLEVPGGVLVYPDSDVREALHRRATQERRDSPRMSVHVRRLLSLWETAEGRRRADRWIRRLLASVPKRDRRHGHRMPYSTDAVRRAQTTGGGLDRFDPWVRMDHVAYRTPPLPTIVRRTLSRLEAFDENRRRRLEGARVLLDLGLVPRGLSVPRDTALLRVPLFVAEREPAIRDLERRDIPTEYVYDPPLDLYAPDLGVALPSPASARIWSRDVLPVHPLHADRVADIIKASPGLYRPLREAL